MKGRILLINPWIHDFAAYDCWSKPAGLLYIAAFLRHNGYSVDFIDCLDYTHPSLVSMSNIRKPKRKHWGQGHFPKEEIPKPSCLSHVKRRYYRYGITPGIFKDELDHHAKPDLILVTSIMTYWYPGVFETISLIKQSFPNVPVVLGGNYASLCSKHAEIFSGADHIITGEGEVKLKQLLEVSCGAELNYVPDRRILDSYPYPAYDLISNLEQVPLMTSRGCPYKCAYCASAFLSNGFRVRDPIKVVDEISYWNSEFGVESFSFYDDALLVDSSKRAVPMMKEIIRRNMNVTFHCPNGLHAKEITEEVALLMRRCSFCTIRLGFETSSIERQINTGGKITNDEFKKAVHHLHKAGYDPPCIGVYILCGLPGQSAEEVKRSIEFVMNNGAKPIIAEYSPIPNTALWNEGVRLSPLDIENEPLFHNNTLLPCAGENLSIEEYHFLKNMTHKNSSKACGNEIQ